MSRKSTSSELSIESNAGTDGGGKRIHMKWKAVPLWYIVLLSIFTLSSADGDARWKALCAMPSLVKKSPISSSKTSNEVLSIIPYSGVCGSKENVSNDYFTALRGGGAAVNPFPSG